MKRDNITRIIVILNISPVYFVWFFLFSWSKLLIYLEFSLNTEAFTNTIRILRLGRAKNKKKNLLILKIVRRRGKKPRDDDVELNIFENNSTLV